MKILEIIVENVKRVKFAHIVTLGKSIIVSGKNKQGKSTILDCITYAFSGAKSFDDQPDIIQKGKNHAQIIIKTEEYEVLRTFTGKSSYLVLKALTGSKIPSPQSLLDKLMSDFTLDPVEFDSKSPSEQIKILKTVLGIAAPLEAIEKDIAELKAIRTPYNSEYIRLKKQIENMKEPKINLPDNEIDINELIKIKDEHDSLTRLISDCQQSLKNLTDTKTFHEKTITDLEARIKVARDAIIDINNKIASKNNQITELETKRHSMIPLSEVLFKLNTAVDTNKEIAYRNEYSKLLNQRDEAGIKVKEITEDIESKERDKSNLMNNIDLPIEGLKWNETGLSLNDIPYTQLSFSERVNISTTLGMLANPKLRVLLVKHGNDFDDEHLKTLIEIADKKDLQLWIERIEPSDAAPTVIIEDGTISFTSIEKDK